MFFDFWSLWLAEYYSYIYVSNLAQNKTFLVKCFLQFIQTFHFLQRKFSIWFTFTHYKTELSTALKYDFFPFFFFYSLFFWFFIFDRKYFCSCQIRQETPQTLIKGSNSSQQSVRTKIRTKKEKKRRGTGKKSPRKEKKEKKSWRNKSPQ